MRITKQNRQICILPGDAVAERAATLLDTEHHIKVNTLRGEAVPTESILLFGANGNYHNKGGVARVGSTEKEFEAWGITVPEVARAASWKVALNPEGPGSKKFSDFIGNLAGLCKIPPKKSGRRVAGQSKGALSKPPRRGGSYGGLYGLDPSQL